MNIAFDDHQTRLAEKSPLRPASAMAVVLAWIAAFITLATCVVLSWIGFYDTPYGDHWIIVPDLGRLDNLMSPHGEHPIFVGRILFWIDWEFFQANGRFLQAMTLALVAAQIPAFVWLARRTGVRRPLLTVAPFAVTMILASREHQNFIAAFQVSFVPAFTLAVWSCCAFVVYLERSSRVMLVAAIVAATLATLSLASGMFVSFALAGMAIMFGRRRVAVLFVAMTMAGFVLSVPAALAAGNANVLSLPSILKFFFVYLGAPALGWGANVAVVAGVATATTASAAILYVLWQRRDHPAFVALAGILTFAMITAIATAAGRSFAGELFGVAGVAGGSRYHIVLGLIYVATGIFAIDALKNVAGPARRAAPSISVVVGGLLLVCALAGVPIVGTFSELHRADVKGVTAMVADVEDQAITDLAGFFVVLGKGDMVAPAVIRLRAQNKSVFADPITQRMRQTLTATERTLPDCGRSSWEASAPEAPDGHRTANGVFVRKQSSMGASHVLISDSTGIIVGYGRVPRRPSDLNPFVQADGRNVDWQGHVRSGAAFPLTAWLATANTIRCSIGRYAAP